MRKEQVIKIIKWSTIALIVPILGKLLVDGWDWGVIDFFFAWVFFNVLGFTYTWVTGNFNHRTTKITMGILVVAVFAFVWVKLATG